MDIADLKGRQGKVDVQGEVIELSEARQVTTSSGATQVANAKLKDTSGEINLSLWNDQVDKVSSGDKIKITNGYVNEFRGELQLSTGKFGTLEVLEKQNSIGKNLKRSILLYIVIAAVVMILFNFVAGQVASKTGALG